MTFLLLPLGRGAKYCDERVCLSIGSRISETTFRTSRNFLYMLTVVVARRSSDDNATCYVFPVLWMTLSLPTIGQAKATPIGVYSKWFARGSTGDEVWCLRLPCVKMKTSAAPPACDIPASRCTRAKASRWWGRPERDGASAGSAVQDAAVERSPCPGCRRSTAASAASTDRSSWNRCLTAVCQDTTPQTCGQFMLSLKYFYYHRYRYLLAFLWLKSRITW